MENEKLESQKIDENKTEKVSGGYSIKVNYAKVDDGPPELIETFFVNDYELKLIQKGGYLNSDGSMSKENYYSLKIGFSLAKIFGDKRFAEEGKNEIKIV